MERVAREAGNLTQKLKAVNPAAFIFSSGANQPSARKLYFAFSQNVSSAMILGFKKEIIAGQSSRLKTDTPLNAVPI